MTLDILVIPIVLLAVIYLVVRYRNRGKGGSSVCNCDGCPSSGDCGSEAPCHEDK